MNPYLTHMLAQDHIRELQLQAYEGRPHVTRSRPRSSVRHRAGWTLVTIGLRLAATPEDA